MIHIVHLCSYYTGSTVYRDLIKQLSEDHRIGSQFVFSPIRQRSLHQRHLLSRTSVATYSVHCLGLLTRVSFLFKQWRLWRSFNSAPVARQALEKASVIHAHTLYADGVLAYLLFRAYGKPYVVTVRGTDVNLGDRFFIFWRPLAKAVLSNAKHVFFVSPSHLSQAKRRYPRQLSAATILPNGIHSFWLQNVVYRKPNSPKKEPIRGIAIGAINRNKNLKTALEAFDLAAKGRNYKFDVFGGTYEEFVEVFGELKPAIQENVNFRGFVTEKAVLKDALVKANVFVMPSFSETFGLTYIESISQATPVVYSEGQGIDGYFQSGETGYPCVPSNVHSVASAIEKTLTRFPNGLHYSPPHQNPASSFSWEGVADILIKIGYITEDHT